MDLSRVRLELTTKIYKKSTYYGFSFTKNDNKCIIYTQNIQQYDIWKSNLYKLCILTTFQSECILGPLIGKGSYGKVYLFEVPCNI